MLKKLWAARWYLLLGGLTFIVTLMLTAPMHWVWRYMAPQLQGLPVQISQVRGHIWQGQLQISSTQLPELGSLDGQWQLAVWPLLLGQVQVQLALENTDMRLLLPLTFNANQLTITQADGYLNLRPLKPLLARERGSAEGEVELQRFNITVQLQPLQIEAVSGRLSYSGGAISLLVDNKPVSAQMPFLVGDLSFADNKAQLLANTEAGDTLFSGQVQNDGWAGLGIRRRFIDVLGQTWPMQADADTVIFEVSRKVF